MTIPEAFQTAVQHHQAGRLAEAEALYRQILAVQPNHADALHYLGVIAQQVGRHELAAEWIRRAIVLNPINPIAHSNLCEALRSLGRFNEAMAVCHRAIELNPHYPNAYLNLGNALRDGGQLDEAISEYRHAIEHRPDYAEAHNNLGTALAERGQFGEAVSACRRALELRPDYPEALMNLGAALARQGRLDEAMAAFRGSIKLKPDYPKAHLNLGNVLREQGQLDEAVAAYRHALDLNPDYVEAHNNLGNVLRERGQFDEAMAACRRALELKPDYAEGHLHLANALWKRGKLEEAIAAYRRALELKPDVPEAYNNLGNALKDQGEMDEAIAAYRHALHLKPEDAWTHSNLIYAQHLHPAYDAMAISEEQQRWNRQFGDPLKRFARPHGNLRSVERRLRIGYVSPDFLDHAVGRFVLPLFECHDRERFEILCYSGVLRPDWMTGRLRALAGRSDAGGGWRNTVGISDARLAEMIREDGVDLLVDLAMHAADNRLPMFAWRPAPVQVAWLAYPGSTGLPAMGYRLTDAYMDPPGERPAWSAEEPVRLPDSWCCYYPAGDSPEINALPALTAEGVTFGSMNNFAKVHEGVLALWARVLKAVRGSRLLILCPEGAARERVRASFGARGIATERLELTGQLSRWDYLGRFQRIDIGLDPFPCNGMTTTCDALWMGVPVVTLPGALPMSRAGLSLLSSVGLGELAASSEEDYVRIAAELAGDLQRLADLRGALRQRMLGSPLMDAPRFARNVEAEYRKMWQAWAEV